MISNTNAMTRKVYGLRNATLTIHIMLTFC
jgi:hypothetical protein